MSEWKKVITTGSAVGDLTNVDATSPTLDHVLKWNGTAWYPSASDTSYAISYIGSPVFANHSVFSSAGGYDIGVGVIGSDTDFDITILMQNIDAVPTAGKIKVTNANLEGSSTGYWNLTDSEVTVTRVGQTLSFNVDASSNAAFDLEYPLLADLGVNSSYANRMTVTVQDLVFGSVTLGNSSVSDYDISNEMFIGIDDDPETINEATIEAFSYHPRTNDFGNHSSSDTKLWAASTHGADATSGNHLVFVLPKRSVTETNTLAFKDDSTGLELDMTKKAVDVDITRNGFLEPFEVYYSTNTGIGEINIKTQR